MKGFNRIVKVWTVLTFLFLYLPIIMIVVTSFSQNRYGLFPFKFTTEWYTYLFTKSDLPGAAWLSVTFSLAVTAAALVIGTMAAFGIRYMSPSLAKKFNGVMQLPITIPWLVQGISLLLLLTLVGGGRSYAGMFFGNMIIVLPYVVMLVAGRLGTLDETQEQAAKLMGANMMQVFKDVTFPAIIPGIMSGGMMAFMVCFNSFCIQYYLAPFGVRTLPVEVFTRIRTGYQPDLNVLATLTILVALIIVIIFTKMGYSAAGLFSGNNSSKKG